MRIDHAVWASPEVGPPAARASYLVQDQSLILFMGLVKVGYRQYYLHQKFY